MYNKFLNFIVHKNNMAKVGVGVVVFALLLICVVLLIDDIAVVVVCVGATFE